MELNIILKILIFYILSFQSSWHFAFYRKLNGPIWIICSPSNFLAKAKSFISSQCRLLSSMNMEFFVSMDASANTTIVWKRRWSDAPLQRTARQRGSAVVEPCWLSGGWCGARVLRWKNWWQQRAWRDEAACGGSGGTDEDEVEGLRGRRHYSSVPSGNRSSHAKASGHDSRLRHVRRRHPPLAPLGSPPRCVWSPGKS